MGKRGDTTNRTRYKGDRNDLNRERISFIIIFLLNGVWMKNAAAGKIWIDCGGTVDGIRKIKGCFGAQNTTKYVNLENGLMKHPNEIFTIKMVNRSKCSMSIDFRNEHIHGKYECGVVLNIPSEQYRYVLFASVNITETDVATLQKT